MFKTEYPYIKIILIINPSENIWRKYSSEGIKINIILSFVDYT